MLTEIKPEIKLFKKVKIHKTRKFQRVGNWILGGSGNFEKTHDNGKYRESCNTVREIMSCEDHKIKGIEIAYNRCGKLDCETCYTSTASKKAKDINDRMLEFKTLAEEQHARVDRIVHFVASPKKSIFIRKLGDYEKFLKFRKKTYKMLKFAGIHSGYIFTHIWSIVCVACGRNESECTCTEDDLLWEVSPHFHVLGFGYLLNTKEFEELYSDWVIVNYGRRDDAYETALYLLTHCSLWRKSNGKLKPAYEAFGGLHPKRFKTVSTKVIVIPKKCSYCKKPMKRVIEGIIIKGDRPQLRDVVTLEYRALSLGINIAGLTREEVEKKISQCVYKNENFRLQASEKDIRLGQEIKYLATQKTYRITSIKTLRDELHRNRKRSKELTRKAKEKTQKEGNGYG